MDISRKTTPELTKELNIPKDIASAMRKSFSRDVLNRCNSHDQLSPIRSVYEDESLCCKNKKCTSIVMTGLDLESNAVEDAAYYQLWNRHMTDSKISRPKKSTYDKLSGIFQEWTSPVYSPAFSKNFQLINSVEDVKLRQWLNPRSSFLAESMNEAKFQSPLSCTAETGTSLNHVCWITLLLESEKLPLIIALNNSILKSKSKFKLLVLYLKDNKSVRDILAAHDIDHIGFVPLKPIMSDEMAKNGKFNMLWPILSLWHTLSDKFRTVCYLGPGTLISTNIDELLETQDEIDNETCIFIKNATKIPSLMILRPYEGIHMVLEEFVTVYGLDWDKLKKLSLADDWNVLNELFPTSFCELSERYGIDVTQMKPEDMGSVKLLDFTTLKPWLRSKDDKDLYINLWWTTLGSSWKL